jgi:pimeloyl-ACP methyl ester carboxylesterase
MRSDVQFQSSGAVLRGWLYRPDGAPKTASGKTPIIVMAHGFSATKELFLDDFAEVFCAAGFAVLVYDHRNFGDSDGELRGEIDPWAQINGYRDAISYAQTLEGIDPERLGVWGSSYSGGHVLVVAAFDKRVKCVISHVPAISGYGSLKRMIPEGAWPSIYANFEKDRAARFAGKPPQMIPAVPEKPGGEGAMMSPDATAFFLGMRERAPTWENSITRRSVEMLSEYEPGFYIERIAPTPLLMIVASQDAIVPADITLAAFARAGEPKKLVTFDCGHFEPYNGPLFPENSAVQRDWFVQHLLG